MKSFSISHFWSALFVSRFAYLRASAVFAVVSGLLVGASLLAKAPPLMAAAGFAGTTGLCLFAISVSGLFLFYGPPAERYYRRIVETSELGEGPISVAELHIGTDRHAYAFAALLPHATIHSVDCWNQEASHVDESIAELRSSESPPEGEPRIICLRANDGKVPMGDASCDAVVLGIGFHEFEPPARERLLVETARILKPGGKVVLFEHVRNLRNALTFGWVIGHWPRRSEWTTLLMRHFDGIAHAPVWPSVDLFMGRRR